MKILLAVDSSKFSEEAARQLCARRWPPGSEVRVLGVVEELSSELIRQAEAAAASSAIMINDNNIAATSFVELGDPQSRIVEYARNWGAAFIFVGTHGHSALTRFVLGSVSRYVVHKAECSVVVVRARSAQSASGSGLRLLLATDGSAGSLTAARSVAARPWPAESQVLVVTALGGDLRDHRKTRTEIKPETGSDAAGTVEVIAAEALRSTSEILRSAGIRIETAALPGDPREVILDRAQQWPADVIVVGSHGKRGIDGLLLGSVSDAVAANAHCTVEVIRNS